MALLKVWQMRGGKFGKCSFNTATTAVVEGDLFFFKERKVADKGAKNIAD